MYRPSGEYSGPSSRPLAVVRRLSWPPSAGIVYMSNSPLRSPQKAIVFPSGDQPCQYDGPDGVISLGVPPVIGSVYIRDCRFPCDWSLIASSVPSGETPWSLLQRVANPVSMFSAFPPVVEMR